MSDDDFLMALIGLGMLRASAAARQQAEYQRQQLNLLRRHQRLPPIPPDPPEQGLAILWLYACWTAAVIVGTAVGFRYHASTGADGPAWAIGIGITWWLCIRASRLIGARVQRRETAFYESWRRAGCP